MSISPKLNVCVKGCKKIYFTDVTGIYDETLNPEGWNTPNISRSDILSAEIIIKDSCDNIIITYPVLGQIPNNITGCFEYAPLEDFCLPEPEYTVIYNIVYNDIESEVIDTTCEIHNIVTNGTFDENLDGWLAFSGATHSGFNGGSVEFIQFQSRIIQTFEGYPAGDYILEFEVLADPLNEDPECHPEIGVSVNNDDGSTEYFPYAPGTHQITIPFLGNIVVTFTGLASVSETCFIYVDNICIRPLTAIQETVVQKTVDYCNTYLNDCNFKCCIDKFISNIPSYLCDKCDTTKLQEALLIEALYLGYLCAASCDKESIRTEIEKRLKRFCNFKDCKC